jgi:hypothetical protein
MDDPRTYGNRTKPPNRRRKRSPGILLLVAAAASGLFLSTLLREQQSPLFVSSLSLPSSSSSSSSKPFSRPEEPTSTTRTIGAAREATTNTNNVSIGIGIGIGLSRRDLLASTTKSGFVTMAIAGGIMVPWLVSTEAAQAASEGIGRGPIAVVGASGRTGSLCVNAVRFIYSFIHLFIYSIRGGRATTFHALVVSTHSLTRRRLFYSASGGEFLSGP